MTDPADIIGRLRAKRDVQTTLAAGVTFAPSADEILRFEAANLIEAQAREVEAFKLAAQSGLVVLCAARDALPGNLRKDADFAIDACRNALSARSTQGGGDD